MHFILEGPSIVNLPLYSQITVILENLFHPDEIIADPSLLKDLDADIKEESATLGPVDKVVHSRNILCSETLIPP